jgi:hypothetical protein
MDLFSTGYHIPGVDRQLRPSLLCRMCLLRVPSATSAASDATLKIGTTTSDARTWLQGRGRLGCAGGV